MLRLGIVGAGAMAEYHAKRFAGIGGMRVAAVCDHLRERALGFAEERGLAAFDDPAEMAASGEVDAIAVASFDGWHKAPVLAALDRGLPVFCEKPLAREYGEAEEMAAAAASSGVPAVVNFSKRNGGLLSLARRAIAGGELGGGLRLELSYLQSWLLQDSWGAWRSNARWKWRLSESLSTHGALGDLGSHLLDAALLLAGEGLAARAFSGRRFRDESPPAGGPFFEPEGGGAFEGFEARLASSSTTAALAADWRAAGKMDSFSVRAEGDSGSLEIDLERSRDSIVIRRGGAARELRAGPVPSTYERFTAVAAGSADPLPEEPIDFARGLAVQRLIADCASLSRAAPGTSDVLLRGDIASKARHY
jgi:predicted dehydrogenase